MFILHINLNLTIFHFLFVEHFKMFVCQYKFDMQYGRFGDSNKDDNLSAFWNILPNLFFIYI